MYRAIHVRSYDTSIINIFPNFTTLLSCTFKYICTGPCLLNSYTEYNKNFFGSHLFSTLTHSLAFQKWKSQNSNSWNGMFQDSHLTMANAWITYMCLTPLYLRNFWLNSDTWSWSRSTSIISVWFYNHLWTNPSNTFHQILTWLSVTFIVPYNMWTPYHVPTLYLYRLVPYTSKNSHTLS